MTNEQYERATVKRQYNLNKAQAKFRREPFELTLKEYCTLWQGKIHLKGRLGTEYAITRLDTTKPWMLDNVAVMTRAELNAFIHTRKM